MNNKIKFSDLLKLQLVVILALWWLINMGAQVVWYIEMFDSSLPTIIISLKTITMSKIKDRFISCAEYLSEEQMTFILELINTSCKTIVCKRNLMKLAYTDDERRRIDSAMPIDYVKTIEEILPSFKTYNHVYNYNDDVRGIENVNERIISKLINLFKI